MATRPLFARHPLPWQAVDEGDDLTTVVDANSKYVVYKNRDLPLADWRQVVALVNQGRTVPKGPGNQPEEES
jgi:hypothetical protein